MHPYRMYIFLYYKILKICLQYFSMQFYIHFYINSFYIIDSHIIKKTWFLIVLITVCSKFLKIKFLSTR